MNEFNPSMVAVLSDPRLANSRVPEADFVKYILPLLVNIEGRKNLDLTNWIDLAGHPNRPIDVINTSGEVMFTVPAVLSRLPTEMPSIQREGPDIGTLLDTYSKMRLSGHPAAADAWLDGELAAVDVEVDQEEIITVLRQMITIYQHYKIPTESLFNNKGDIKTEETISTTAAPVNEAEGLSGQFDDF